MGPLREDVLRIALPLTIVLSTAIAWAGDVNNPANNSLLTMSAKRQADILGKIAGDGCKGKTAFYQGTMKDLPQRLLLWRLRRRHRRRLHRDDGRRLNRGRLHRRGGLRGGRSRWPHAACDVVRDSGPRLIISARALCYRNRNKRNPDPRSIRESGDSRFFPRESTAVGSCPTNARTSRSLRCAAFRVAGS